ncbi:MAG: hypothetical protein P3T54_05335 [Dehalogenimonas sp.]|jgi:hypothetical protein|uniref:DUF4082 domain-containing protein n=1 Tax=Candidatus Dehalogenimonas loeffleri TaxID=3127115 RepID=A0ABZ2J2A3_9CHLR|nr:hypothetical protein [Dehalogenimonas sp.]
MGNAWAATGLAISTDPWSFGESHNIDINLLGYTGWAMMSTWFWDIGTFAVTYNIYDVTGGYYVDSRTLYSREFAIVFQEDTPIYGSINTTLQADRTYLIFLHAYIDASASDMTSFSQSWSNGPDYYTTWSMIELAYNN